MSAAYLQRLFDRAAIAPLVLALPGGPSRSPVAAADQRLNEPGFAEMFSFAPMPADGEAEADPGLPAMVPPEPRPRRKADTPDAPAFSAEPAPQEDGLRPPPAVRSPKPSAQAPAQPAPAAMELVRPVGEVRADDFVPPAPAEGSAPRPLPDAEPPPPAPAVVPAVALDETAVQSPPPNPQAAPTRPTTRVGAEPPSARNWSVDAAPNVVEGPPPEPRTAEAEAETDRPPLRLASPPQPVVPPLPEPQAHEAPPPAETRRARPEPTVREVVREEMATKEPPAPRRPMTAAEASLIGPLSSEPRARTLFGRRRR